MSFFSRKETPERVHVVIDIGSGSVAVALVHTKEDATTDFLWSHREYILTKGYTDIKELLRDIHTALMNALLEFGSNGLRTLQGELRPKDIEGILVTVSAPWAHTATQVVRFEKEEPFTVSDEFIDDLIKTSKKETEESQKQIAALGLQTISETVAEITLNEYVVADPDGKEAKAVTVSIITSAVQEKIISSVQEGIEKILPGVSISFFSFIDVLYKTLKILKPHTSEIVIVDVTDEASEVGIVRDDVLRHCNFAPAGLYSIARNISAELGLPKEEAYSLLKHTAEDLKEMYKAAEQEKLTALFTAYEDALVQLLQDTGDSLNIPQSIFVHTDSNTAPFVLERVKNAAARVSTTKKTILLISKEAFGEEKATDSAIALGAYFLKVTNPS